MSTTTALGLRADDAVVVHDSNRIAVRLMPCDTLARVAPMRHRAGAEFEVTVARALAQPGSPIASLDARVEPRVHARDGFALTFWTYYPPLAPAISPPEYAEALRRMHAGMRGPAVPAPHFSDRVAQAQALLVDPGQTPELPKADRELLGNALTQLTSAVGGRGAAEQLLHGEPHPGNLMRTKDGVLVVDLETCCRGPVEFDVAHAPEEVANNYPGLDPDLLRACRLLVLAMITTWRWDRDDELPNGRALGIEWLGQLRAALGP